MIFDIKERTNWSIKKFPQSNFNFLNESAWPLAAFARDFIEKYTLEMNADREQISKLQSKQDKQHDAAMLELMLYALCSEYGTGIRKVDTLQNVKTPDFEITYSGSLKAFIECTLAENAMESQQENRKKEAVMKIIEELVDRPYLISVNFNRVSDSSIVKKKFVRFIDLIYQTYNHHLAPGQMTDFYPFEEDGWELEVSLAGKAGEVSRSRGGTSGSADIIDNFSKLYNALNDKLPGKYKLSGQPYVICVGVNDLSANEAEFAEVLFFQLDAERINLKYPGKAFFTLNGSPVNTSVSAVLFYKNTDILNLPGAELSLWHNPFAALPFPEHVVPAKEYKWTMEGSYLNRQVIQESVDLFDVLKIDRKKHMELYSAENRQPPSTRTQ